MIKYTSKQGYIHGIGLDPSFYVMYLFKEQPEMYKIINRNKDSYFTMDATGSVVTKLTLPDGSKSPHLFLYQCMIVPKNK